MLKFKFAKTCAKQSKLLINGIVELVTLCKSRDYIKYLPVNHISIISYSCSSSPPITVCLCFSFSPFRSRRPYTTQSLNQLRKVSVDFFLILFFSWLVHTSVHSMLNFSCRRMAHRFFAEEKLQRFDIG